MSRSEGSTIERVAGWLREAQHAVVFTGAGISTESGIPDFRSPGGVWSKNRPVYFDEFMSSAAARHEYWRQKSAAADAFINAEPNVAHRTIGEWERCGRIVAVITQNIDGLHQDGGSRRVLELHGTARWIACLDCEERFEPIPLIEEFRATQQVPPCPTCGGRLKSATVSFGQMLPTGILEQSFALAEASDLFFAIGSSLVVHPAASLPDVARSAAARLVIINRDETPLDAAADVVIREPIGQTIAAIDQALKRTAPLSARNSD